jgi:ATP-dependent DNA helicase DinG
MQVGGGPGEQTAILQRLARIFGPLCAFVHPGGAPVVSRPDPGVGVAVLEADGRLETARLTNPGTDRTEAAIALRGRPLALDVDSMRSAAAGRTGLEGTWLDLQELALVLHPEWSEFDLEYLVSRLLGREARPGAADRARDLLLVAAALADEVDRGRHDDILDVVELVSRDWSWSGLFRSRTDHGLGELGRAASRRGARPEAGRAPPPQALLEPIDISDPALDIGALLADSARWELAMPGYRLREGQVELSEAILSALDGDRALAIEAGTGIGKTLGYALAAFLHLSRSEGAIVVSSANRTLQEKLVTEALPAVARALGHAELPAIVLKGRSNYGNPQRARTLAESMSDEEGLALRAASRVYIANFFRRCPRRDLQGFGGILADRDPALAVVRERIACSGECDVRACRREPGGACGYLSRVDALGTARVVSINHALLLSWPGRYGTIDRLVVDEAHELVGEGDRAFGETVGAGDVRQILRRIDLDPRRGAVGVLASRAGRADRLEEGQRLVRQVLSASEHFGDSLEGPLGGQERIVPPDSLITESDRWAPCVVAAEALVASLGALLAWVEAILPSVPVGGPRGGVSSEDQSHRGEPGSVGHDSLDPDVDAGGQDVLEREGQGLLRSLKALVGGVLSEVFTQIREEHVYAARVFRRRGGNWDWSLSVTPLDPSEWIWARALEAPQSVVALSATLGVGGDPMPTLEKLGWKHIPRARKMPPLLLPSPFDYENNAVLGLVRGADYRSSGFARECAAAVCAVANLLEGRTMALFTSRARLREVAELVREELGSSGLHVLEQGPGGGAGPLVDRFVADPRSVLLGTRSLFQGVDVPGDALSCVLIDKLPFPQPNTPLFLGRKAFLQQRGEDPFQALSLEPAVVLFKQMFGRLIRTESDRGFVVVLGADPTRGYVQDFVSSLPGPPRVVVDRFGAIFEQMEEFFGLKAGELQPPGRG